MASDICIGNQYLWVPNQRLQRLVEFVVQVGRDVKSTSDENQYVDRLDHWIKNEYWNEEMGSGLFSTNDPRHSGLRYFAQ